MTLPPAPPLERCYRHPHRETGRRCTRCGRPACSDCLVTASVGSHCVECVRAARPDVRTRARHAVARQPTMVTYALIAINAAVFLWTISGRGTPGGVSQREIDLGLFERSPVNGVWRGVAEGEWYRLVSSGFLHFTVLHVGMNMLLLFQLGQLLEPGLGPVRYTLLYFAALLCGSAGALLLSPDALSGGASGAVFGLMTAGAVGMKRRGISPFSSGLGTVLLLNLVLTFTIPNISVGGHVGGAIGGGLCALVLFAPRTRPVPTWVTYLTPAAVAVAAAALSVGVTA